MTRRERLERKLEKRREWAESRNAEASRRFTAARAEVSGIPLGQPILIGHHSEGRHRRALERSDNNMRKGCEASDMAKHHASKAAGLSSQLESTIFSDDPDAVEQLQARIAELETKRDEWKRLNAWWRKHKTMQGCPGLSEAEAARFDTEIPQRYSFHQQPYPSCTMTNLGANIRRLKQRITEVERRQANAQAAEDAGGVAVKVSGEWCSVTFAEKPSRDVLNALKAAGFYWGRGSWSGKAANLPECVTAHA